MVHWLTFQLEGCSVTFWHSQAATVQSQLQDVLHESICRRNKCEYDEYNHAEEPHLVCLAESIMIFGTVKLLKLHLHNFAFTPNVSIFNVSKMCLKFSSRATIKLI